MVFRTYYISVTSQYYHNIPSLASTIWGTITKTRWTQIFRTSKLAHYFIINRPFFSLISVHLYLSLFVAFITLSDSLRNLMVVCNYPLCIVSTKNVHERFTTSILLSLNCILANIHENRYNLRTNHLLF